MSNAGFSDVISNSTKIEKNAAWIDGDQCPADRRAGSFENNILHAVPAKKARMSYGSILVHLDFDRGSKSRLQYATDLAGDLGAYLIGLATTANRVEHSDEVPMRDSGTVIDQNTVRNRMRFNELKRHFFSIAGNGCNSGWRTAADLPTRALIENSRAVDLIVSGTPHGAEPDDIYLSAEPGALVCGSGRPVLFVAEGAEFRHPECALIGWKDTPEARRAVLFALPFLRLAERTVVVAMSDEVNGAHEAGAADTARYLTRHGIEARFKTVTGKHGAEGFLEAIREENADLVVTGANGHGGMRERMLGGITSMLLMQNDLNRLMAG
jgi:nucleotide-binding universal stress UspA family protein